MARRGMAWFLVHLILGLYFIAVGLNFINFSFLTDTVQKWIMVIGGGLIIISGLMSLRRNPGRI